MKTFKYVFFSAVFLPYCFGLQAQVNLPKNPTVRQLVGYHYYQQQVWEAKALPKNSVLYKNNYRITAWQPQEVNDKFPAFSIQRNIVSFIPNDMPVGTTVKISWQPMPLRSYLYNQNNYYHKTQRQSWWKDPSKATGSQILRDLLW